MQIQTLQAPSKTFLIGEYDVLTGNLALLINTPPLFTLQATCVKKTKLSPIFHADSPAGKLLALHADFFQQYQLDFIDPYQGAGGFGASSAQFVLLAKLLGMSNPWQIWQCYRELTQSAQRIGPSGADVMAQCTGGVTFFHAQQKQLENIIWPFSGLDIALLHTGQKIPTHQHLQAFAIPPENTLTEITMMAYDSLRSAQQTVFLQTIREYAEQLLRLNLVAEYTQTILKKMQQRAEILACKGCGALGADVILAIISTTAKQNFIHWAAQENLRVIYCDHQFANGVLT